MEQPVPHVLIAEDTVTQAKLLKYYLEQEKYQVTWAQNGKEALDLLKQGKHFDLVMTDIEMPEMDGLTLLSEIRKEPAFKNLPVIVLTAMQDAEISVKALKAQASDFLPKPYKAEEAKIRARNLIQLHHLQKLLMSENVQLNEELVRKNAELNQNLTKLEESHEQLKSMQAQLVETSKLASLAVMGGGIAHEINTPLGALNLYNDLLGEMTETSPPDLDGIKQINQKIRLSITKIARIVKHVKDFSRAAGQGAPRQTVDLNQVLQGLRDFYGERASSGSIDAQYEYADGPLPVHVDTTALEHIFLNLIQNACDAMEKTEVRRLRVRTERQGNLAVVRISDTGHGIPAELLNKIYDPFFTTKEPGKGTGLGLSLVRSYLKDCQGKISVESSPQGTTFTITFELTGNQTG